MAVLRTGPTESLIQGLHQSVFRAEKRIGLVLFGKGNIGSRWLELFAREQSTLSARTGFEFVLAGVVDSRRSLLSYDGLDASRALAFFNDEAVEQDEESLFLWMRAHPYDDLVVLDVTASQQLADQYLDFASHGFHVISANKLAGASDSNKYRQIHDAFEKTGRHWLYNATVGAGLPINHTVRDLIDSEAFSGCELVHDTHRLALMNAMLHGIEGPITLGDTLSNAGKGMKGFDLVLTNPPFGTKKGGERATRDDFTYPTSNKQLNFLQHIYRSLKHGGRAAVVLPDNVLFADGDGAKIRADLMDKCNLHTILRLPTGIFYAQGVKTNVLFFSRGSTDKGNTQEVWFYDLRTNMPSFGKTSPLKKEHFADFEAAYEAADRRAVQDERWSVFTREEIAAKADSLDLGLIRDDSVLDYEDLPDPIESGEECIAQLEEAVDLLKSVVKELQSLTRAEA